MSETGRLAAHGLRQIDESSGRSRPGARRHAGAGAGLRRRELLEQIAADRSLEQLQNVATLPGIVEAALAMPDIHQGYGFPVGGVAATELPDGVVSPGGVGYDINCGVRLLALPLIAAELGARREPLVHEISRRVPAGAGHGGPLARRGRSSTACSREGPRAPGRRARDRHARRTSSAPSRQGCLGGADRRGVRARARARGDQLGTLGSGNHFVEVQRVERVLDRPRPRRSGCARGR